MFDFALCARDVPRSDGLSAAVASAQDAAQDAQQAAQQAAAEAAKAQNVAWPKMGRWELLMAVCFGDVSIGERKDKQFGRIEDCW